MSVFVPSTIMETGIQFVGAPRSLAMTTSVAALTTPAARPDASNVSRTLLAEMPDTRPLTGWTTSQFVAAVFGVTATSSMNQPSAVLLESEPNRNRTCASWPAYADRSNATCCQPPVPARHGVPFVNGEPVPPTMTNG